MSWDGVLGRVSFINCDPVFHTIPDSWKVLSAPPSWLTGHLLRRDCITAPIPTADYASNVGKLRLIRDIGIVGQESVGSVLLFGNRSIETMRDIALPSDSSTSNMLMRWILNQRGLDPKYVKMGPDMDSMLDECDGALIIGDRAIAAAIQNPELVRMDLGREWVKITGLPMVFGVFAARKDSEVHSISRARELMLGNYNIFLEEEEVRNAVILDASKKVSLSAERVGEYYANEVSNLLSPESIKGLRVFLKEVCAIDSNPNWFDHI
ncbi:MAG: menaquinone biosynthesis protein [Candidatus Thalassarchaeaceae archaeon]|nr:menaquinone biosynthesis protein [Candidatus Thalassarchaeaceae archaeon]